jgi:phosphomannomutase
VIRVMVEADEREEADAAARELAAVVEKEARA